MASDLPEFRHADGLAMAKVLVTYISDPITVRNLIRAEFGDWGGRTLSLVTIDRLREEYLESKRKKPETFSPNEGYWPDKASLAAQTANQEFIARLRATYPERFAA